MPRKLGDKDKTKRKSRKLLVNSALLGIPTGLGLLAGKGASNYWSNTKGIEKYGARTLTPKLLQEFYNNKELTKEHRKDLVKRIKSLNKPQLQKLDSEINLLADQKLERPKFSLYETYNNPAKKLEYEKQLKEYNRLDEQRDFYRQMRRKVRDSNRKVKDSYQKAKNDAIRYYRDTLQDEALKYADTKRDRLYNTAYSKVKRVNLIKGGLIGLGVGSALLGVNELRNRNKRNRLK
jgi:hypothetical protein